MARVDFYLLDRPGEDARRHFACRLAEKAWRLDNSVYILTGSPEDALRMDELLWTFRDGSFVPHHVAGSAAFDSPVVIGHTDDDAGQRDLLINLGNRLPACAGAFPRVAELVTSDEECRQQSRRRFAEYRDQGHELETHQV